jgi:hypothetical protein
MADEPKKVDVDQMNHIQREVERVLLQYRENTEAAIVVSALMRCARILIRQYPERAQKDLLTVTIAFLRGDDVEVEGENTLLLPPGFRVM